jgi:transcription elongation GreA/GreB family factor
MMTEEVEKLVAAGKIAPNQAPALSLLMPGACCLHETFGPGKVAEWDVLGEKVLVDFEGKPRHPMGLRIVLKTLRPLAPDHILAQFVADPAGVRALAADDPVAFVGNVLRGERGSMGFTEFEMVVKGRIVSDAEYKKWWDRAKKSLKGHREFIIPSKRTEPLQLRETGLSPAEQLVEDFDLARDLGEKARLLDQMRRNLNFFPDPRGELGPVLAGATEVAMKSQRLNASGAIELMLARDALAGAIPEFALPGDLPGLAELVRVESDHLADGLKGLSATACRKVGLVLAAAFGEAWVETAVGLLDQCGPKGFAELAAVLTTDPQGRESLEAWIQRGLTRRSLGPDALAWICRERGGLAKAYFGFEAALALTEAIERTFSASGSTRGNKALDVLVDDRDLIPDLLRPLPESEVRAFVKRLLNTPAIDDLTRRSLLARAIKTHEFVQEMVSGGEPAAPREERLLVTAASLQRKREELDDIVQRQIPENTRQLQIAREYGDLRENFEFKSAKQTQHFLSSRRAELEREINNAQVTDFGDVGTDKIAPGTVVTIRFPGDGGTREVTILGAWDSDPAAHVFSYLSPAAQAMLGAGVGDEVAVASESDNEPRRGVVAAISRWSPAP